MDEYQYYLAGEWGTGNPYTVRCPYDSEPVGAVHRAGPAALERAVVAANAALAETRALPAHRRATILRTIAAGITARSEEFARTIALEAGKPIKQARGEVARGAATFAAAADEASRSSDEALRLDAAPGGENRQGIVRRFPVGPIGAITPFNFPLNLVAHKIAPAIAAGCPIILKPAPQTPITALLLADLIAQTDWPRGALSVLPLDNDHAGPLIEDPRLKMFTFTGSVAAGWALKQRAGQKKVTLELGGNAGCIIHTDADLALAATRCAMGGFTYAGQSCISVQRIFVHDSVYQTFLDAFVPLVQELKTGHPLDEAADLSALIDTRSVERVSAWLDEARRGGAQTLVGGEIHGSVVTPTVLINAAPDLKVNCAEVFAPVVTVQTYTDYADALRRVNDSEFGLQAGVFTRDIGRAFEAFETLEVGGVIINDVPTWRVDPMPYGGLKNSGQGREGLRYAIEEMTEPRLLVFNLG